MYERIEEEPEQSQSSLKPALTYLLGIETARRREFGGLHIAKLLYEVSCDPRRELIEKLFRTAKGIEVNILKNVVDEISDEEDAARQNFLNSLGDIIEDSRDPNISLKADAVRLAYTINAWELASSVHFLDEMIADAPDYELSAWRHLIKEKDRFFAHMRHAQAVREDKLAAFREFVSTLDFDGFDDKKE